MHNFAANGISSKTNGFGPIAEVPLLFAAIIWETDVNQLGSDRPLRRACRGNRVRIPGKGHYCEAHAAKPGHPSCRKGTEPL